MARIAFAGDTMLGRLCAEATAPGPTADLLDDAILAFLAEADLVVANLECCISDRGQRWPDPDKPFFFRAPPTAAALLADWGVDVVTLANNHALDYGRAALLDTLDHLAAAGVGTVGAGGDRDAARASWTRDVAGQRVAVLAVTDHPAEYAASIQQAGTAYADLPAGVPDWLATQVRQAARSCDVTVVTPHWGPNMTTAPVRHVRVAGGALVDAGATVVAGHSAHVFHGARLTAGACVLWDLGDFLDDYAVDPRLRNDLGLLWAVELDGARPVAVEALSLHLGLCRTDVASGPDARWIARRLVAACAPFGTAVHRQLDGRLRLSPLRRG